MDAPVDNFMLFVSYKDECLQLKPPKLTPNTPNPTTHNPSQIPLLVQIVQSRHFRSRQSPVIDTDIIDIVCSQCTVLTYHQC